MKPFPFFEAIIPIKIASQKHMSASRIKGTEWPKYWKKNPPKGGATRLPKEINASAIPRALRIQLYLFFISRGLPLTLFINCESICNKT